MIIDTIDNASKYYGLGERIAKGLKILSETNWTDQPDGRMEIDGGNLFALVVTVDTKPIEEAFFEAHP